MGHGGCGELVMGVGQCRCCKVLVTAAGAAGGRVAAAGGVGAA